MKPRYLFLLKFLGYSFILFIFGHQLLHAYATLLGRGMQFTNPQYRLPLNIENFLYGSSMTIIAFVGLIFSTPNISLLKKATVLIIGIGAFFLTDLLFVQYVVFPQGQPASNEDSPVFEMYLCIKWLLPFLLWMVMCYPYWGEVFGIANKVSETRTEKKSTTK